MSESRRIALGLDFGTLSVRALAVDARTGEELVEATVDYPHGVIDRVLPDDGRALPPEFALQHPQDWIDGALGVIRAVLRRVPAEAVIGIGVDFTACTMLPVREDGMPLCQLAAFADDPQAWPKLWKHHAAQPQAERVQSLAAEYGETFLRYTGGVISSEWMLPKCMEILEVSPRVFDAADGIVDAGDWLVFAMTGRWVRNACAAGYKGHWNAETGFPSAAFLERLDPRLVGVLDKWCQNVRAAGSRAGTVTAHFAALSGLREGTPVSAATIDAHAGVAGTGVTGEGRMSVIMGTSSCHMVLSRRLVLFEGFAGVVQDGILPGYYGYESGQAASGDALGWFAKDFMGAGTDDFAALAAKAMALKPGESGLLALDWLNGNRSILMDPRLSGALVGLTLATRPEHVYRALVEGVAHGTRVIIESFESAGIPIGELVACGGLANDPFIVQMHADITGKNVLVASSRQASALGAAIFGAMAAGSEHGGPRNAEEAILRMTRPPVRTFRPDADAAEIHAQLHVEWRRLHDRFGRDAARLMSRVKDIRDLAATLRHMPA